MANPSKRKLSDKMSKPVAQRNEEASGLLSQNKRSRFSSMKSDNESSTDSFSHLYCTTVDSERSSDSEIEEHAYSRSASLANKRLRHSRAHSRFNSANSISQFDGNDSTNGNSKKSKCTSKNAMMARLNRLKKKKYIEDLEVKNAELKAENDMLKNMLESRAKEVESLKRKTLNLENVIRNSTEIGSLLKCVSQHTDLEISSSLLKTVPNHLSNTEVKVDAEKASSSIIHDLEVSSDEEEALVAAILWGLALHTFCQPCKPRTSDILNLQVQKFESDTG